MSAFSYRKILVGMLAASSWMAAGCGSSDGDGSAAEIASLCELMADAELAVDACLDSPSSTSREIYMAQCQAWLLPYYQDGTVATAPSDLLDNCRRAVAETCTPATRKSWNENFRDCRYTTGQLTIGEPCTDRIQAEAGTFCLTAGSCGAIVARYPDAAPCEVNSQCQSSYCTQNVCTPKVVAEGNRCSSHRQCMDSDPALECRANVCRRVVNNGQDCSEALCAWGLVCRTRDAGATYKCQPWAVLGEACVARADTNFDVLPFCADDLACLQGRCAKRPVVGPGAACGYEVANCNVNSWCVDGTCAEITPPGQACTNDDACGPYGVCHRNLCTYSTYVDTCYPTEPTEA